MIVSQKNLPDIHALWVGEKLGVLAACCLKSFMQRGHDVFLHTYNEILDIPDGVKVLDANIIIKKEKIIKHKKTGSYALFSDIFRYELLKYLKGEGIYVDCDVYCVRPLKQEDYVVAFEDDNKINGAILALPVGSQVLASLLKAAYDPYFIPPWYSKSKQFRLKLKKILGLSRHVSEMPWGVIGPEAITYFFKQLNLIDYVKPMDVFYPVHYQCVSKLFDPDLRIEDIISHRTQCIHLYNEMLRNIPLDQVHPESVLGKMLSNSIYVSENIKHDVNG